MIERLTREEAADWLAGTDHVYPAPVDVDMLEGDWRADVADPARKAFLHVPAAADMPGPDLEDATAVALAQVLSRMDVRRALVIGRGLKGDYEPLAPDDTSEWQGREHHIALLRDNLETPPRFGGALAIEGDPEEVASVSEILAHGAWASGVSGLWTWLCPGAGLILRSCHHRHLHTWPAGAEAQSRHDAACEALGLVRQDGCAPPG